MTPQLENWAQCNIICGAPGTGKSTLADTIINKTHFKNVLLLLQDIDLYNSMKPGKPFHKLPYLKNVYDYKGGKVKLSADDIELDKLLTLCVNSYRNGMLIIDEAGLYRLTWNNKENNRIEPIPAFKEILKQRRKYNIETYLLYHGVSEIPVQIMDYFNNIILFHQSGEFRNKAMVPRHDEIMKMRDRVREKYMAGNRFYCERIKLS